MNHQSDKILSITYSKDETEDPLSLNPDSFHPLEWKFWGSGNYWIKIPHSFATPSVLEFTYPLVDKGEFFVLGENGMVQKSSFGIENFSTGNNNRLYTYSFNTSENAKEYLFHIRSSWVKMPFFVHSPQKFASENRKRVLAISFSLGVLFVLFLLQFNLYLFRNETGYLWIALVVLAILAFLSLETGFLFRIVPNGIPGWNSRILPITISLHFIIMGIYAFRQRTNENKLGWPLTVTLVGIPWILLFCSALLESNLLYHCVIIGTLIHIMLILWSINAKWPITQKSIFLLNIYIGMWTLYLINLWFGISQGLPWIILAGLIFSLIFLALSHQGNISMVNKISSNGLPVNFFTKMDIAELTKRENEVFGLLIEGKSNQDIAEILHISLSTVKSFVSNIYGKLNLKTRSEAILKYKKEE